MPFVSPSTVRCLSYLPIRSVTVLEENARLKGLYGTTSRSKTPFQENKTRPSLRFAANKYITSASPLMQNRERGGKLY